MCKMFWYALKIGGHIHFVIEMSTQNPFTGITQELLYKEEWFWQKEL